MGKPRKVAILIESDYYEHEIWYYRYRFREANIDAQFMTRLWGNQSITFTGHEYKAPFTCDKSFEGLSDQDLDSFGAVIVPSAMVSDRLRYTQDVDKLPPATEFLARAFARKNIIKGIICHGLWLVAPKPDLVRGRPLTCHNNLHGDALAYGAKYVNQDLVVDGDLVTARTGDDAHLFAAKIIEMIDCG